jgi:hypothetical protein
VNLAKTVDLVQLNTIIGSIGGRYGCRTCGLLGFDLELQGDPGDFSDVAALPGVQSVNFE